MANLTKSAFAILVIAATLGLTVTVILATAQQASAANCLGEAESQAATTRERYGQDVSTFAQLYPGAEADQVQQFQCRGKP
jgi:hypothetical protein